MARFSRVECKRLFLAMIGFLCEDWVNEAVLEEGKVRDL